VTRVERAAVEDVEVLRRLLRRDDQTRAWLEHLERIATHELDAALPAADDLAAVLLELAVPHEDIDALVALRPSREGTPAVWWLLERCVQVLAGEMGVIGRPVGPEWFPRLRGVRGGVGRYFYVYVFVAALPRVRAYHRAHGIPDEVSRLTLADLGRNMAVHRRRRGAGGLAEPYWLRLHFSGRIYQLGRLQFELARLGGRTGRGVAAAGMPFTTGDPALAVHVPAFYGPLSPEACDASFARAREFFARHFPDERYAVATCHSWLLDEQLAEYLPADANIVRFQRRFRPAYRPDPTPFPSILRFVFGLEHAPDAAAPTPEELDALPRRTALERAVADHLRAGRRWHDAAGWLLL
jgi:hypothetical protein